MPVRAVVFDVDRTLAPSVSWTALTSALGASAAVHLRVYRSYAHGRIDYLTSKRALLSLWRSTGRARLDVFREVFERMPLRDGAEDVVGELRRRGYELCLISGSMDLYVAAVAARLSIGRYFFNTELVFDDSGQLLDLHYELDQAGRKLRQLGEYAGSLGLAPREIVAVGDGDNDSELFDYTGNGVLLVDRGRPAPRRAIASARTRIAELGQLLDLLPPLHN